VFRIRGRVLYKRLKFKFKKAQNSIYLDHYLDYYLDYLDQDLSLFYLDHSFANAAKPRSRSV